MTPTHKIQTLLQVDVPKFGSRTEFVVLHPKVIEAKWTRNNHLQADILTVTVGWKEGGIDPRVMRNARGAFWLWDASKENFNDLKHLRFTGIAKKAERKIHETGWAVDITFHDYTTLFIGNKPMKSSGMPSWDDTLLDVWRRICDNTGWQDPSNGQILSSVAALKDKLVFKSQEFSQRKVGEIVPQRFHAISKPQPKTGASSWDVWQWCVTALGLISYIDRDQCIVTDTTEHYKKEQAALAIYGRNIHTLEENSDAEMSQKGILLKSFDHLNGRVMEAFYPLPGDERLKVKRASVGPKSEGGESVTANEVSGDYEEFERFDIQDQATLQRAAEQAYYERSRQEILTKFKTAEVELDTADGKTVDIFDLRAGDAIAVVTEPGLRDLLEDIGGSGTWGDRSQNQIRYLVDQVGYDEDVAKLIVSNIQTDALRDPIFHVRTLDVDLKPESFEVELISHNLIRISV